MNKKVDFAQNLLRLCSHAKNVAISGHKTPDYDSICSSLAMQEILRQNGIKADVILEKELDEYFYDYLRGFEYKTAGTMADCFIGVDISEKNRLPKLALELADNAENTFVIDHHKYESLWAKFNQVWVGESSACEVIFRTFFPHFKLNKDLAKIFYIGIYSDTGGFVYSNTKSTTFDIISKLVAFDIKPDEIVRDCFEKISSKAFEINKRAINNVSFLDEGQIAVSILRYSDYQEVGIPYSGSKFIVSYLQNVEGVKVAINVFEPEPKVYHISFRTAIDGVDVSEIASHFKGGGHMRASGITLQGDLEKSINAVVKQTEKVLGIAK